MSRGSPGRRLCLILAPGFALRSARATPRYARLACLERSGTSADIHGPGLAARESLAVERGDREHFNGRRGEPHLVGGERLVSGYRPNFQGRPPSRAPAPAPRRRVMPGRIRVVLGRRMTVMPPLTINTFEADASVRYVAEHDCLDRSGDRPHTVVRERCREARSSSNRSATSARRRR